MKLGVTVGKFYPYHRGHDFLISTAKQQVERLVVLVCWKPTDKLSGKLRADWIREMHPEVEVMEVLDDLPEAPEPWAIRTLELLAGRKPDVAFSSEDYGEPWARFMNAQHTTVDRQREQFPVSGTMLRADLAAHWQWLTPPAKAHFAKRVSIVGVESSGTTTLARALAEHYQTVHVPEYGRYYWEGRQSAKDPCHWESYEFVQIAKSQAQWEDDLARRANKLVIGDTDPLATQVWHRRYMGSYNAQVQEVFASRHYDLHLVTQPDFAFVQDGTRDGEHIRHAMHDWFLEALEENRCRYRVVAGSHEQRMALAVQAIESVLRFPPIEH